MKSTLFTCCAAIWRYQFNNTITILWISQQPTLQLTNGNDSIFRRGIFYQLRVSCRNLLCFALLAVEVMWIAVNEIWDFYALQCSFNPQVQLYNDNSVNKSTTNTPNNNWIILFFSPRYFLPPGNVLEKLLLFRINRCESMMSLHSWLCNFFVWVKYRWYLQYNATGCWFLCWYNAWFQWFNGTPATTQFRFEYGFLTL